MMIKYISTLLLILTLNTLSFAQRPSEIQLTDEAVDWSDPWKIGFYIALPIFLVISAFYLRYRAKTKRNKED